MKSFVKAHSFHFKSCFLFFYFYFWKKDFDSYGAFVNSICCKIGQETWLLGDSDIFFHALIIMRKIIFELVLVLLNLVAISSVLILEKLFFLALVTLK